jgi:DNA-binding MarR family transcriptional regulator
MMSVLEYSSTDIIEGKAMADNSPTDIPAPGQRKRGEQGYLAYLLRQASAAVRHSIERALADLDVTQPQFVVMTMINAYPGSSGADIARLAMLTPQTISLIVANLERAGRLTRVVSPAHGRIQRMELTEDGQALLARCRERVHKIEARLNANLTPEHRHAVRSWLVEVATKDLNADEPRDVRPAPTSGDQQTSRNETFDVSERDASTSSI